MEIAIGLKEALCVARLRLYLQGGVMEIAIGLKEASCVARLRLYLREGVMERVILGTRKIQH
jgi:hypothetical protein